MLSTLGRGTRCAGGAALLGLLTLSAPAKPQTPIVELPQFVVRDSRVLPPPEAWRYARIPGFEILSSASDRSTQHLLQDFERFREAVNVVWPMPRQLDTPVLLILCDHAGRFQTFLPPKTEAGADLARASVLLNGRLRSAIVVDASRTVINVSSPDAANPDPGEDPNQFAVQADKELYRQYIHYLLSRSTPRLPAWFEEGMVQIVMAMQFTPKWIELGHVHQAGTVSAAAGMAASLDDAEARLEDDVRQLGGAPGAAGADNAQSVTGQSRALLPATDKPLNLAPEPELMGAQPVEDEDFNTALADRALLPMSELFGARHDSPEALNPLGNNTWAKQAYAFVHLGLFGERGRWRKPFLEFVIRSTREPVTEAMFKECFHMSYRAMDLELRGYIEVTDYESKIYRARDGRAFLSAQPVLLRKATAAEIGRIKGEALELAGNEAAARLELIAPYIRRQSDADLLAALGEFEHAGGREDRARRFLAAAVAENTTDGEAYVELARARIAAADAKPAGGDGRYSPAQAEAITSLLLPACRLPPLRPGTYELLAQVLARRSGRPTKAEIAPLVAGVRLFPSHLRLVYQTAALCAAAGLDDSAGSLIDYGLKHAQTAAARAQFTTLERSLTPTRSR